MHSSQLGHSYLIIINAIGPEEERAMQTIYGTEKTLVRFTGTDLPKSSAKAHEGQEGNWRQPK